MAQDSPTPTVCPCGSGCTTPNEVCPQCVGRTLPEGLMFPCGFCGELSPDDDAAWSEHVDAFVCENCSIC